MGKDPTPLVEVITTVVAAAAAAVMVEAGIAGVVVVEVAVDEWLELRYEFTT